MPTIGGKNGIDSDSLNASTASQQCPIFGTFGGFKTMGTTGNLQVNLITIGKVTANNLSSSYSGSVA